MLPISSEVSSEPYLPAEPANKGAAESAADFRDTTPSATDDDTGPWGQVLPADCLERNPAFVWEKLRDVI